MKIGDNQYIITTKVLHMPKKPEDSVDFWWLASPNSANLIYLHHIIRGLNGQSEISKNMS